MTFPLDIIWCMFTTTLKQLSVFPYFKEKIIVISLREILNFNGPFIYQIYESIMHLGWKKTFKKSIVFIGFLGLIYQEVSQKLHHMQRVKNTENVQAELHPILKVTVSLHSIHMDATGKHSGKRDSKEYVLVSIDAFMKYVLLYHTMNMDANSTIKAQQASESLLGSPSRVIADQSRCFAREECKGFYAKIVITYITSLLVLDAVMDKEMRDVYTS